MEILGFGIGAVALFLFIWLLPFFVILFSNRTHGVEKLAWILAVIFISWFAWIFYLIFAPISAPKREKNKI